MCSPRAAANPFTMPPEEEVFRMREAEKLRKDQEREELRHMSVADKTTFCSRSAAKGSRMIAEERRSRPPQVGTRRSLARLNPLGLALPTRVSPRLPASGPLLFYGALFLASRVPSSKRAGGRALGMFAAPEAGRMSGVDGVVCTVQGDTAAQQAMPADHRRREKEVMSEFLQKKREIFLVQMSLDTKRAEIRKLEERAIQREDALKKSEKMLEEDALRFEAFLKENDLKVQEAIKKAEVAAKTKQDKLQEIKRLNAAIAAIKSELSKYEEQLEDCKKYKDFLDNITPADFFQEQALERVRRREAQLQAWEGECAKVRELKEKSRQEKKQAEEDYANARTQQEAERAEVRPPHPRRRGAAAPSRAPRCGYLPFGGAGVALSPF